MTEKEPYESEAFSTSWKIAEFVIAGKVLHSKGLLLTVLAPSYPRRNSSKYTRYDFKSLGK